MPDVGTHETNRYNYTLPGTTQPLNQTGSVKGHVYPKCAKKKILKYAWRSASQENDRLPASKE